MLHLKYDCNWPTGFRDIHVSEIFMFQRYSCFMFESVKRHTDRRTQAHTDAGSSPNLYAHLVSHRLRGAKKLKLAAQTACMQCECKVR